MTTLDVKDITCSYGIKEVLKEINFSTDSSSFLGIIGPNASGKSTLIRTITRVLKPKEGAVLIDDEDIDRLDGKELAKELAVVPQEDPAECPFTVLKMIMLGRTPHLSPLEMEDEEDLSVVREALELTETWNLADRPFTELSGGEKRKVIIAKALAQEPSILLLDEPTSHLDINNQLEILNLIEKLRKEKEMGIIASFHDLNLAARYCDSLILLHEKKVFAKGSPEEVLSEDKLKEVYGVEVSVRRLPETYSLSVISLPNLPAGKESSSKPTIHLICGGGTGAPLMHTLARFGCRLTAGVLSPLDDDYKEAQRLGIQVIENPPFSPIKEKTHRANQELIEKANLVILTDMPIGHGNLKNLKAAAEAIDSKPILLLERRPMADRDFTLGGKAQEICSKLKENGAVTVTDVREVPSLVYRSIKDKPTSGD